tara:strand:+ start:9242 stop:9691 length:450 start_codon:yes stop_codon:yes gene_type:complete
MSFLEELGPPVEEVTESDYVEKIKKISPFDFASSINDTKQNLIVDQATESQYSPFIVNRALGFGADTVIAANEMNSRPHIDSKMQYEFLRGVIRKGKRYNKWIKAEESDLEAVQQYFSYSFNKAKEALRMLSPEDIEVIKHKLATRKGG